MALYKIQCCQAAKSTSSPFTIFSSLPDGPGSVRQGSVENKQRTGKRGCCKTEVEQQPPLFAKSRIGRDFFKNFRRNSLQIILSRRSKAELSAMRKPGFLCFFRCHKYLLFFERKKMCFPSVLSQFGAVLVQIKGQTQQKQFQRDVGFPSHKEAFELAVAF